MKTSSFALMLTLGLVPLITACGAAATAPAAVPPSRVGGTQAAVSAPPALAPAAVAAAPAAPIVVAIAGQASSAFKGSATLTETNEGVTVKLSVEGVTPGGDHGAHVHENGDCSSPDFKSAGGHFNPQGNDHGLPVTTKRHLGDLGNLSIGPDGKGSLEITIPGATLKPGDPNSFAGKAIIVHAKKDDGGQPTGNAGDRIGCGVIGG